MPGAMWSFQSLFNQQNDAWGYSKVLEISWVLIWLSEEYLMQKILNEALKGKNIL